MVFSARLVVSVVAFEEEIVTGGATDSTGAEDTTTLGERLGDGLEDKVEAGLGEVANGGVSGAPQAARVAIAIPIDTSLISFIVISLRNFRFELRSASFSGS